MNEFQTKVWRGLRRCTAQSEKTLSAALGEPYGSVRRALDDLAEIGRVESRVRAGELVWVALAPRSDRRRR